MHPIPLAPFPGEGGHDAEGAACLWDVQAYSYLCYALYSAPRLAFGKGRYARPPAGGCSSMPCGIATSPEGRGKNVLT